MPDLPQEAPALGPFHPSDSVGIASFASSLRVFHKDTDTATNTPADIIKILNGDHASAASCIVVPCPAGASYVELMHAWRDGTTAPSTIPVVRVFGKLPRPNDQKTSTRGYPVEVDSAFTTVQDSGSYEAWVPLGNRASNLFLLPLGSASDGIPCQYDALWSLSVPTTVNTCGTTHILVSISTPAASGGGNSLLAGLVVGYFGY